MNMGWLSGRAREEIAARFGRFPVVGKKFPCHSIQFPAHRAQGILQQVIAVIAENRT
jgi:hypothetical protein